jgi:hypothetical protein
MAFPRPILAREANRRNTSSGTFGVDRATIYRLPEASA